jgi:hypothetical protein
MDNFVRVEHCFKQQDDGTWMEVIVGYTDDKNGTILDAIEHKSKPNFETMFPGQKPIYEKQLN